jgi:hypothetical protein
VPWLEEAEAKAKAKAKADTLIRELEARGGRPDGWTAGARWEREDDIPDGVFFRALEALG